MHVLTIVDPDQWSFGQGKRGVFPGGPLELTVSASSDWTVSILRVWCPNEIEASAS